MDTFILIKLIRKKQPYQTQQMHIVLVNLGFTRHMTGAQPPQKNLFSQDLCFFGERNWDVQFSGAFVMQEEMKRAKVEERERERERECRKESGVKVGAREERVRKREFAERKHFC